MNTRFQALALLLALASHTAIAQTANQPATLPVEQPSTNLVARALAGELVSVQGEDVSPVAGENLAKTRFVAFYYSAKWCPPCVAFTPSLVEAYKDIRAKHPEFELIFVSNDRNASAMADYMKSYKMPFPAIRYDRIDALPLLRRPDHESGIPNLVFMDATGKELSLSFEKNGDYRGPRAVLSDIRKHFSM